LNKVLKAEKAKPRPARNNSGKENLLLEKKDYWKKNNCKKEGRLTSLASKKGFT